MKITMTSFKLGLFALLGIAGAALVALALGLRAMPEDTVTYHMYFDESVTGLEIGAPVRYRGVPIGTVKKVAVAPDNRHVEVTTGVRTEDAPKLVWTAERDTGMRAELDAQGITGVKLVNIDFVDPETHPPPALPFVPGDNYVPSTQSLLDALGKRLSETADRLPVLADAMIATVNQLDAIFVDISEQGLPARAGGALDGMHGAVTQLGSVLRGFDRAQIPEKTGAMLARLDASVEAIARMLAGVNGDGGLIASAQRATDSVARLGSNTSGATQDLDRTIRDLGDAARAVRSVADELDRDPDRLIKGPAKARSR
jgi:ABC-type transporter Mla subunit MlaD